MGGTNRDHVAWEARLATPHGKEAAVLFTSRYSAGKGTLSVLARCIYDCADVDAQRPELFGTESVRSMRDRIDPLTEIADTAKRYGAVMCVDEVHAGQGLRDDRRLSPGQPS